MIVLATLPGEEGGWPVKMIVVGVGCGVWSDFLTSGSGSWGLVTTAGSRGKYNSAEFLTSSSLVQSDN